jgi:HEAT repeat protein
MEALAAIGTPAAKNAIRQALNSANLETQLQAAKRLSEIGEPVDLEGIIIAALRGTGLSSGLSQAIDIAEQHPSPRLQQALLDLALNGTEEQRIHCAALALYHGGKADEAFDWNHRPFFLRFGDDDRRVQIEAYRELCARLGITPKA